LSEHFALSLRSLWLAGTPAKQNCFVGIITGVILPPSIALVQHPPTYVFVDSFGPGGPVFHPDPDLYTYNFTGGDSTHWSDCFNVTAPSDHFGFWREWWAAKEDRVAHILAVAII
jgi:hypothetical protein